MNEAFALWITGLPESRKTTLAHAILHKLEDAKKIHAAHLECGELSKLLAGDRIPSSKDPDWFHRVLLYTGRLLVSQGVPVVFDATMLNRADGDTAREAIPRFLEIRASSDVPPDGTPKDQVIDTAGVSPEQAADLVLAELSRRSWV